MRASRIGATAFVGALLVTVCGTSAPLPATSGEDVAIADDVADDTAVDDADDEAADADVLADDARDGGASSDGGGAPEGTDAAGSAPCPDDMVAIDTTYCPDVERECTDLEYDKINHLPICHAFAHRQRCRLPRRRIAFCIDRYEYPNRRGAHPTWMLDWYEAQATCESKGKRLCWASEWTAACEGPQHLPFPYGWERDHDKCNIDSFYIEPKRFGPNGAFFFYARDPEVRAKELERLDRSVPSGSMESCKSGYGVYDMTGNVDEWVTSDVKPRESSRWAGLKGGAWGHVRSQCRPMTYSHVPSFAYYFVGFRCCRDVEGAPRWKPAAGADPAPDVAPFDFATEDIETPSAPGPSRVKFTRPRPPKAP